MKVSDKVKLIKAVWNSPEGKQLMDQTFDELFLPTGYNSDTNKVIWDHAIFSFLKRWKAVADMDSKDLEKIIQQEKSSENARDALDRLESLIYDDSGDLLP